VCALHGLCFGILYAPFEALVYNLGFQGMLVWIAKGFGFDFIHFCGNIATGLFIMPVSDLLLRLTRKYSAR
jgi:hypothetical protein